MAGRKKKKKEEASGPSSPAWMTTYGDMMTLLLCFFVLLVSMSTMEIEKFKAAAASLKGALSVLPFQERVTPEPQRPKNADELKKSRDRNRRRKRAISRLRRIIEEQNLGNYIKVYETTEGIHIIIGDPALFDSGQAVIKSEFYPVLDGVVEVIHAGTGDENVRVEGHTDNVPINTPQFKDNWELSIARALEVIRYIKAKELIDPRRLRPVGAGEFHPVAPNDTPEGRALNRRVEIFIEM